MVVNSPDIATQRMDEKEESGPTTHSSMPLDQTLQSMADNPPLQAQAVASLEEDDDEGIIVDR